MVCFFWRWIEWPPPFLFCVCLLWRWLEWDHTFLFCDSWRQSCHSLYLQKGLDDWVFSEYFFFPFRPFRRKIVNFLYCFIESLSLCKTDAQTLFDAVCKHFSLLLRKIEHFVFVYER